MNNLAIEPEVIIGVGDPVAFIEDQLAGKLESAEIVQRAQELPFWQWALEASLWIDRESFTYDDFAYLLPIYQTVPSDPDDLFGFEMTVMKAAQMGGTVIFLLLSIYLSIRFSSNLGYYLPDQTTAMDFSKTRFIEMVQSNPGLLSLMLDYYGRRDEGSMSVRRIGNSHVFFLYTGMNIGAVGQRITMRTEAMPLDVLFFDEVQGMSRSQIEKTLERISASKLRVKGMVSTPRWPEADIHEFFLLSNQQMWHSDCRCAEGIVLSDEWPNCIGHSQGRIFYVCPHCGTEIKDPQKGQYIAHNPSSHIPGFHFAQTLSKRMPPSEIWQAWLVAHDKQNFYNRKLGKPWSNPDEVPISLQLLKDKVYSKDLSWSVSGGENYMGIDHMGALNVVVIKRKLPEGKERIIHLEWIEDLDPFPRCGQLMGEYDIRYCTLENEPNYNEAFRFAKEFGGRVFIVEYSQGTLVGEMLRWQDRSKSDPDSIRKTSDEARMRWAVRVDQYKFMSYSLGKLQDGIVQCPDPQAHPLMRPRLVKGRRVPDNIAVLFASHLCKVALKTELVEGENRYQKKVVKIGSEDPHFAYANMCCDVAIARAYGTTRLINSELEEEAQRNKQEQGEGSPDMAQIRRALPMAGRIIKETCGGCVSFIPSVSDGTVGRCQGYIWQNAEVKDTDIKCEEYGPKEEGT